MTRVFCTGVPFSFNEKFAGDVDKALKDIQVKENATSDDLALFVQTLLGHESLS